MIKTKKPLPDKPSELIRLALNDLRECEQMEDVEIDMSVWYYRESDNIGIPERPICHVCLAGAVIHREFDLSQVNWNDESDELVPCELEEANKLGALNEFRVGCIRSGLKELKIPAEIYEKFSTCRTMPAYRKDREGFYRALERLANEFQMAGI